MAAKKKKPILMVSSAVYGFEELLDRIYATLSTLGYEVWMSHKGTMPVDPKLTALESCRRAVKDCDLFLGIILPRYGSGKEKPKDDSIVHEELRMAIAEKKPRWILAHDHVVFARSLIDNVCKEMKLKRGEMKLKRSAIFEDLRILDMYDLATRQDVEVYRDRTGNWVQKFGSIDEASLFAVSQFRRYQEAEAFISDNFGDSGAVKKVTKKKGGKL
ncbi:MAG: DUF4062 domain-containing protein [Akkermansiaceae bacterium]|nr:DUF4062 domain-containing protein [Akkermansiaceae bacterium]